MTPIRENEETSLLSSALPPGKSLQQRFLDSRLAKVMGTSESAKKAPRYIQSFSSQAFSTL